MNILNILLIILASVSCSKLDMNRDILPKQLKPTITARNSSNFKHCSKENSKSKFKIDPKATKTSYFKRMVLPAVNICKKGNFEQMQLSKISRVTKKFTVNQSKSNIARNSSSCNQCSKAKSKSKSEIELPKTTKMNYFKRLTRPAVNISEKGNSGQMQLSKLPPVTLKFTLNLEKQKYVKVLPVGSKKSLNIVIQNPNFKRHRQTSLMYPNTLPSIMEVSNIGKLITDDIPIISLKIRVKRFFMQLKYVLKERKKGNVGKRTYFSKDFEIIEEESNSFFEKIMIHLCLTGESLYSSAIPWISPDRLNEFGSLISKICP